MSGIVNAARVTVAGFTAVYLDSAVDTAVDVHAATGTVATVFQLPYVTKSSVATLKTTIAGLTGGTSPGVVFTVQTSVDGTVWTNTQVVSASQTSNGSIVSAPFVNDNSGATKTVQKFVRVTWATSGAPTAVNLTDLRIVIQNL